MAKTVRLDELPMLRRTQAKGGSGLLLRQEVTPDTTLNLERRPGYVRTARRADSLGATMDGDSATARWTRDGNITVSSDLTIGFSVRVGDILDATGEVVLLDLSRTDGDAFQVKLVRDATGLLLRAQVYENGTTNVSVDTGYTATGADIHVALRFTASSSLIEFDTSGDLTSDLSVSAAALTLDTTAYQLSLLGDRSKTTPKPLHRPCVISNVVRYDSRISDVSTILNTRTPAGSPVDHYKLDGDDGLFDTNDGSAATLLLPHPSPPVLHDGLLQFNGRSSALRVELTAKVEQLFATKLRSVADTGFSFYLKGRNKKTGNAEQVLLHFGALAKIKIDATTQLVSFTYNGTTVTTTSATIPAGQAYEVYAYRDGTTLGIKVIASSTETVTITSNDLLPPTLDFARIPKLWIGADEDSSLTTQFGGHLEVFALFQEPVLFNPGPGPASLFYVDSANVKDSLTIEDESPSNAAITPVAHSTINGTPAFAPGPIEDAAHVAVVGGEVLAEGNFVGYDFSKVRVNKQLATDAVAARFGENVIISSGDRLHIANTRKKTVRPLGIPKPTTEVSTLSVAPGALGGAATYGYRAVSRDGTYGPVLRLDPVIAEQNAKILLGSSSSEGVDLDSELGETYAQTQTTSSSQSRLDLGTSAGRPFETGDEMPVSVHARVKDFDFDDLEELIWERGIYQDGTDRVHFDSKQSSLGIDPKQDWTIQASFRYEAPPSSNNFRASGIVGIARHEGTRAGGTGTCVYNADFCAVIFNGGHTNMEGTPYGSYAPYGKSSPKLVCYISRQEWFQSYGFSGPTQDHMIANYIPITFTNDSWTEGNDYSIFFQRKADALNVFVHDKTADTWTTLTARSMADLSEVSAYGPKTLAAVSAYDGSDFFSGWNPKTPSRGLVFGGAQNHAIQVPFIRESDGQADQSDYFYTFYDPILRLSNYDTAWNYVYNQKGDVAHYHYRFWDRAVNENDLKNHGEKRFAAQPGEALNIGCMYDFGCVLEDISETPTKVGDGLSSAVQWHLREKRDNKTVKYFAQDAAVLTSTVQPIVTFAESGTAFSAAALCLYVSSQGDGRVVLQSSAGAGTYVLTNRLWPGAVYNPGRVKRLEDYDEFVNDFDEFNWYTIAIEITDPNSSGSDRAFRVNGMAINGNTIWDQAIGGNDTEINSSGWASDWIWLGGHADSTTNAYKVEIGEFRFWDADKGPDVDGRSGFDYLVGRVPSNKLSDLLIYAKMQPSDGYEDGDGKASGANKLYQYGSLSDEFDLQDSTGRAVIYDSRTASQEGEDPAPQIAFPQNPREDIVAYELCRTRFVPLLDYDDEAERQKALDTARGRPLHLLARIPVGTTHYLDNTPDEVLGYSVQYEEYSTPPVAKQAVVWQDHIAIAGDNRRIYLSEPGPFSWETYPSSLIYNVRAEGSSGSDITAIQSNGTELYIFGEDWATAVIGSPGAESELSLGSGVGAYNARCVAHISGKVYTFNGRLWALGRASATKSSASTATRGVQAQDLGQEVQDLLPTTSASRLAVSRDLQSLFVINETTGDVIRHYLPTEEFTKEKRDATCVGDDSSGVGTWVTRDGAYGKENASVYADDVQTTSTTTASTGTIASGSETFTCSVAPTDVHVGMRVGLVDQNGATADGRITSVVGAAVTLTSGDMSGLADGSGTLYYGVSAEGMLLDTGYIDTQSEDSHLRHLVISTQAGSALEYGAAAAPTTGDRESISDVQFGSVVESHCAAGMRGRFVRGLLRNRTPEQTKVTFFALGLEVPENA